MANVGERIKQAWERAGFRNQRQAAIGLGWTPQRLSKYIAQGRVPDVAALQHMAQVFGVPASWFITDGDDVAAQRSILLKLFDLMGISPDEADIYANVFLESLMLLQAQAGSSEPQLTTDQIVGLLWQRQLSLLPRK